MNDFMISITRLGSPQTMFLLTFFILVFLWNHKKYNHMIQLGLFMSLGGISVYLLKRLIQSPRPVGGLITEYGYGFPSGHTTMATLFFLIVIYSYQNHLKSTFKRYLFTLGCVLMIVLISYSRVYLGVHSWTDVIGGYALGTLWFIGSTFFFTGVSKKHPQLSAYQHTHKPLR